MPVKFRIELRPEPGSDGLRGLRALLKRALRAHQLRCVGLELVADDDAQIEEKNPFPLKPACSHLAISAPPAFA